MSSPQSAAGEVIEGPAPVNGHWEMADKTVTGHECPVSFDLT